MLCVTPGDCEHEVSTVRFGRQVKSLCDLRGSEIWTNCRHHGYCTLEKRGQMAFDFGLEESDEEDW